MRYEIKNVSNQPLLIAVGKETVKLNIRESIQIGERDYNPQLEILKARKLIKIIKQ